MRNILFLALISLSFIACEDVTDPRPVIQGEANAVLFRSNVQAASISNNVISIEGVDLDEVTLQINGDTPGTYEITPNSGNAATFVLEGVTFSTADPEASGLIEIEEITNTYVTGNFYFEAIRSGTDEKLNFSKGVFYRIPFANPTPPEEAE